VGGCRYTRAGKYWRHTRRSAVDVRPPRAHRPPQGRPHPSCFAFPGYRNGKEAGCCVSNIGTRRDRLPHVGFRGEQGEGASR